MVLTVCTSTHLAKLLDSVGAKRDQAWPAWAGLHALHTIIGRWVTPQEVHQHRATILHARWVRGVVRCERCEV